MLYEIKSSILKLKFLSSLPKESTSTIDICAANAGGSGGIIISGYGGDIGGGGGGGGGGG